MLPKLPLGTLTTISPFSPCPAHLRVSVEVVECLRQEAGYVDQLAEVSRKRSFSSRSRKRF